MGLSLFQFAGKSFPATRHEADMILTAFNLYAHYFKGDVDLGDLATTLENHHSNNSNHDEIREISTALRQVYSRMMVSAVEMHRCFATNTLNSIRHDRLMPFIKKSPERLSHFIRGKVARENIFRSELDIAQLDPFVIISICDRGYTSTISVPQHDFQPAFA